MNKWKPEELEFLHRHYPSMGKIWCVTALGRSEASVRAKAAELGLKLDPHSTFFLEFQKKSRIVKSWQKKGQTKHC